MPKSKKRSFTLKNQNVRRVGLVLLLLLAILFTVACRSAKSWTTANEAVGSAESYYVLYEATETEQDMFEGDCYDLNQTELSDCVIKVGTCSLQASSSYWPDLTEYDVYYTGGTGLWDDYNSQYISYSSSTYNWYEDENGNQYDTENDNVVYYYESTTDLDLNSCSETSQVDVFECNEFTTVYISILAYEYDNYCTAVVTDWDATEITLGVVTTTSQVFDPTNAELNAYLDDPENGASSKAFWMGPYFIGTVDLYFDEGTFNIGNITDESTYVALMSNPSVYEVGIDEEGIAFTYRQVAK